MGKRKADCDLVRFVWKRNKEYDVMLLSAVQSKNPFAFKNARPIWMDISKDLQNGPLQMKVTERSCRDRALELLKSHRYNERKSSAASGVTEPEPTELENLLTSVAKLQDAGQDKDVRKVYASQDKSEADAIRAAAVASIGTTYDSDDESSIFFIGNENVQENSAPNDFVASSPSVAEFTISNGCVNESTSANPSVFQSVEFNGCVNESTSTTESVYQSAESNDCVIVSTPPNENVPNENVPNENVPNENVPNENVPNENVPNENVPNENVPNENVPNENVPNENVPNENVPNENVPNENVPNENVPNENVPNENVPNENVPNENVPNENVPNENVPNENVPNENVPNENVPNENVPNENVPNENVPNENVPNENVPQSAESNDCVIMSSSPNGSVTSLHPGVRATGDSNDCVIISSSLNGAGTNSNRSAASASGVRRAKASTAIDTSFDVNLQRFFPPDDEEGEDGRRDGDLSEKLNNSGGSSGRSNQKQEVVRYLERKSVREFDIRKEEIQIRREEVKIKHKEVEIKSKEAENKAKELDIFLEKSKADSENQKRITDLLVALVNRN